MTNTINNVPRELLERVLNAGWGSETVNALDDLRDFLESAPSPAGVDGWDVAGDILEKLSAAQAIIDGLRADISGDCAYRNGLIAGFGFGINDDEAGYQRSLDRYQSEIHEARADRDQQAQRIGELEGLLLECRSEFDTSEASDFEIDMRQRIETALSAGKEGE